MQRTAAETRTHVLGVAQSLFYRNSIRATGVDLVAAEAGVAPTTLYRLFGSKDELVGAYIEHGDLDFREKFSARVAAISDPRDQILAIFDQVIEQIDAEDFRGCLAQMSLAEFPNTALPAHRNAVTAKSWLRSTLGELTTRLGVENPAVLADQLMLIAEGMLASTMSLGPSGPVANARQLVESLLPSADSRPAVK